MCNTIYIKSEEECCNECTHFRPDVRFNPICNKWEITDCIHMNICKYRRRTLKEIANELLDLYRDSERQLLNATGYDAQEERDFYAKIDKYKKEIEDAET